MKKPQPYERVNQTFRAILVNNFLGGIAWGLGATVGLSILVAILTLVLKHVNLVPIVGRFLSEVLDFMAKNNTHLPM